MATVDFLVWYMRDVTASHSPNNYRMNDHHNCSPSPSIMTEHPEQAPLLLSYSVALLHSSDI